jgi:anti-sigma regulatory factor (Ser/Thr protein kinase)
VATRWETDEEAGLEIPARAEYVSLVRLFVGSLASSRRLLDEERIDNLKLAVSEACTNAIEAYRDPTGQRVKIRWRQGGDRLEVGVEDSGPGFDLRRVPRAPRRRPVEPREAVERREALEQRETQPRQPAHERPARKPAPLPAERGLGIRLIRSLVDEVTFQPSESGTAVRLVMRRDPPDGTDAHAPAGGDGRRPGTPGRPDTTP